MAALKTTHTTVRRSCLPALTSLMLSAGLLLSGCLNDGTVPDTHLITFEKPKPDGGPTQLQALSSLKTWLLYNVPDGAAAKDVSVGPVRYAAILFPFPEKDFFVCGRYTAKNDFGTYLPPQDVLMITRVYNPSEGWKASLVKPNTDAAYRQYCIGQPHQ